MTNNLRMFMIFLLVLLLSVLPLPDFLRVMRPSWVLLFVLYVQFFMPRWFSVVGVVFIGLCLDGIGVTVLGEHAFALLVTTWIASRKTRRFIFFSTLQQILFIAMCVFTYQLLLALTEFWMGYHPIWWTIGIKSLMSLLVWPWLRFLLESRWRSIIA